MAEATTDPNNENWLILRLEEHQLLVIAGALVLLPLVVPYTALATNILIYGLFAVAYNLVYGRLGMLSFGHAALFGAGAYGCALAMLALNIPWPLAIFCGMATGAATAFVIGYLAVRAKGVAFSFVTLALAQCVYFLVEHGQPLTGGESGLRGINVKKFSVLGQDMDFSNPTTKYFIVLAFVMAALWALKRILGSPFGAALEAIRGHETRALACGYNVWRIKLIAFVLSGLFSGLAGALYALHLSTVTLDTLHYTTSGLIVMMALMGGFATFIGPFIGAAVFLVLRDVISTWTEHWQLFVGLLFIAIVLYFRQGILGTIFAKVRR